MATYNPPNNRQPEPAPPETSRARRYGREDSGRVTTAAG